MVVITPTQKTALYFFPSYSETAFPNYIICVCLAIKAGRHHFVALLYSKTCNWCSLLCWAAKKCSLLDKAFVQWCSDFVGLLLGVVLPKGKASDCVIWGTFPGSAQEMSLSVSHTTVIYSVKIPFHAGNFILLSRSSGWQIHPVFNVTHSECQVAAFLRRQRPPGKAKELKRAEQY